MHAGARKPDWPSDMNPEGSHMHLGQWATGTVHCRVVIMPIIYHENTIGSESRWPRR